MVAGPSDFELLDAWGAGDTAAGETLLERYFAPLFRFFHHRAPDHCSDLVQQTMLACVEGRHRFRRASGFRTYVFQIARFQLYGHHRKRMRYAVAELDSSALRDSRSSPSHRVARTQDCRRLLEALRQLPIDYQIVIELSYWEGFSSSEVAAVLEIPDASVRSRVARATARLRSEMERLSGRSLLDTLDDLPAWSRRVREARDARDATARD